MDNGFQFLDIVLFAAVAGFLLLRLRSVLGRRTGNERQRVDPFAAPKPLPASPRQPLGAEDQGQPHAASGPALAGVAAVKAADPSFDEAAFLKGARTAFALIVKAFAAGDTTALESLLNKEVFATFAEAIHAREAAKETLQTTLVAIKDTEIVDASIEGPAALVTVKLVSDQINVTRASDGKIVEGDPDKPVEKTDFWTFNRLVRSRDPNWTLVATHSS